MVNVCDEIKLNKTVFTNDNIPPFVFDMMCAFTDIRKTDTVDSIYLNSTDDKLEIYIFYEKENFEIENKIGKYLSDWEEQYRYFPEIFIYPLDMIEGKELVLPKTARAV